MTGDKLITYTTDTEPRDYDTITAVVVPVPPGKFTAHIGEQVMVRMDDPDHMTLIPAAAQVVRIAMVAGVADGFGSMLTFASPLVIPRAPRMPRFTVCDMYGSLIA